MRSFQEAHSDEDKIYYLIGRIIAEWSETYEAIISTINHILTHDYVLRKRESPRGWIDRSIIRPNWPSARRVETHIGYLRKFGIHFLKGDTGLLVAWDDTILRVRKLYKHRNTLAHSSILISPFFESAYVECRSSSLDEKQLVNYHEPFTELSLKEAFEKPRFTIVQLQDILNEAVQVRSEIRYLTAHQSKGDESPLPSIPSK